VVEVTKWRDLQPSVVTGRATVVLKEPEATISLVGSQRCETEFCVRL
jgi:hypothetical protein